MPEAPTSDVSWPGPSIRDGGDGDLDWAWRLNNAAQPAVNGLEPSDLETLVSWSQRFLVIEHEGRAAGFVLALEGPGLPYESLNYRWFSSQFDSFLYVDRVVVDQSLRAGGLGRALYGALGTSAAGRWPRICAEVNVEPPNPRSLRFHERFGFQSVGEQDTEGGKKRVRLLEYTVPQACEG